MIYRGKQMRHVERRIASFAFAALLIAGCGDADESQDATDEDITEEPERSDEGEPEATEDEAPEEADDEQGSDAVEEPDATDDTAGEEPGVVLLSEPITHAEGGLELEVDAVRIISIDELSEMADEDFTELLEDSQAVTFVGLRVTMRNTTESPVEWYPGGIGSAIVLEGQQGEPNFLGDWGTTLRAGAETEINPYYESRVPVDEARAAGEFVWDVGEAYDEETFDTITDPELTIAYSY
jgi:hypothetical protein